MREEEVHWYVLYTKPQHEKKVAALLEQRHIEYFLPLQKRKRRWSDRYKIIEFPVFPGYLFVHIEWGASHTPVLRLPGSLNFIRQEGGGPAIMPDEDLENLKLLTDSGSELIGEPDKDFPPGQEVLIRFGPLRGVRGVVIRVGKGGRVFVRVPLLNQMVSAEIEAIDLEKML